jgi:ubiquinone/menaquinone biosynthesis C-methylase UbiE
MSDTQIRFDDGAGYEQMMGVWSRLVGEEFLDWVKPPSGVKWIDIGCGNGAFTAMIVDRCAPSAVQGVDPSEGQLAYARSRLAGSVAEFRQGEGAALPFADNSFDMAIMALVVFFLPDPPKGVSEMVRVLRPGGMAAAYAWDMLGGGFTLEPIFVELREMGISPALPPSVEAANTETLRVLWSNAGLGEIETREITVQRTFNDFDEYWATSMKGPGASLGVAGIPPEALGEFKRRVRARLTTDASGRVICTARANAVKGRKPA